MTKQRRTFTPEFKREAACLVLDQGYSHTEAARSLGLVESALRRWVNQLQQERGGVTLRIHAIRTLSPPTSGHSFHAHPDRQSERSDAGSHC
jgi:transposase